MSVQDITGQELLTLTNSYLGAYQNARLPADILRAINAGKDEVWLILKSLKDDYFLTNSQTTDNTLDNYFGALSTSTREYTLPSDLRELKWIEVTGPSGYEDVEFVKRDMGHPDFQAVRNEANANAGALAASTYVYDIVGARTLVLAAFPEAAFTLKLWYVRWLADIELDTTLSEILTPYSKRIAEYAAKRITLSLQDEGAFAAWAQEWREAVVNMAQGAAPRDMGARYVQDFIG